MFCDKDAGYKVEIVWVLKSLEASMSAALCDGMFNGFEAIFFVKLLPWMLMGTNKAMHIISDALHPHCKQNLMKNIGEAYFVLEHDKTTNH